MSNRESKSERRSTNPNSFSITILEKIEKKILQIEKEIKIQTFHWGEERWQVRNKFLAKVLELDADPIPEYNLPML